MQQLPSPTDIDANYDVILDAIFGFSFKGGVIRAPFDGILDALKQCKSPICSVDVPSGRYCGITKHHDLYPYYILGNL